VKQIFKGRTGHSRKESDPDPFVGQDLEVLNWTLGLHFATKNPKNSNNLTFSKKHIFQRLHQPLVMEPRNSESCSLLLQQVDWETGIVTLLIMIFAMNMRRIQMPVS
jgi:hypothetical protein